MDADNMVFVGKYPYYNFKFLNKTPEVINGRYHYQIGFIAEEPMVQDNVVFTQGGIDNMKPLTLVCGEELHQRLQTFIEGEFLTIQRGQDGQPHIGRGFINWELLNNMSDEEKAEMYDDLLYTFTGRKAAP
jgi:hypothetical protein